MCSVAARVIRASSAALHWSLWHNLRPFFIALEETCLLGSQFVRIRQLATVGDSDRLDGQIVLADRILLHFLDDILAFDDATKNRVFLVQVRSRTKTDEELRTIRVRTRVGHRQEAAVSVRVPDLFVVELVAVDAHTSGAVLVCRVTALRHEALDDSVENVALIVQVLVVSLARADDAEILRSQRHRLAEEFEDNTPGEVRLLLVADRNIEEGLLILWVELW